MLSAVDMAGIFLLIVSYVSKEKANAESWLGRYGGWLVVANRFLRV